MTAPKAIIFDAEGVIVDSEPVWDEGQRLFLARRGVVYDRALVKARLTGQSMVDGVRTLKELYDIPGDPAHLARERIEIVRELMENVNFVPGFREFFDSVRDGYAHCVATAMENELLAIVDRRLRLRELFGGRVYTLADVGFRSKPDPSLFLFSAAQLEVAPAACVVIEDSPLGVEAAHRAGMRAIGLATTYSPEVLAQADRVARSFDEVHLQAIA